MGNILKNLRKKKGYTQEELSLLIHVSRQTISNWEREKYLPDLENLKILSSFYGISITELTETNILTKKSVEDPNNKNIAYFLSFLSLTSIITPLAAIILLYLTLESKDKINYKFYIFLRNYAIALSILNISIIFGVIIYSFIA